MTKSTDIHVYVVGSAGVGKSTLVERVADLLAGLGVTHIYTVQRDPQKRPIVAHARTLEWSSAKGHRNVRSNDVGSPREED